MDSYRELAVLCVQHLGTGPSPVSGLSGNLVCLLCVCCVKQSRIRQNSAEIQTEPLDSIVNERPDI